MGSGETDRTECILAKQNYSQDYMFFRVFESLRRAADNYKWHENSLQPRPRGSNLLSIGGTTSFENKQKTLRLWHFKNCTGELRQITACIT